MWIYHGVNRSRTRRMAFYNHNNLFILLFLSGQYRYSLELERLSWLPYYFLINTLNIGLIRVLLYVQLSVHLAAAAAAAAVLPFTRERPAAAGVEMTGATAWCVDFNTSSCTHTQHTRTHTHTHSHSTRMHAQTTFFIGSL